MFGLITMCFEIICRNRFYLTFTFFLYQTCDYWDSSTNMYMSAPENQPGVVTDFILYISTIPSHKCKWQKTVAFAAHCQLEKSLDRYWVYTLYIIVIFVEPHCGEGDIPYFS